MSIDTVYFKKIIIIFWMIWWLIALWTDIVGGLAHLGILHATWAPDLNYPFLVNTLKMYPLSSWAAPIFLISILLWSALSAGWFTFASISLRQKQSIWLPRARTAFIISLTYWLAFFIADQLVMKFDLEQNHMVQGGFELLTFLSLYLIPDNDLRGEQN